MDLQVTSIRITIRIYRIYRGNEILLILSRNACDKVALVIVILSHGSYKSTQPLK